MRPSAYLYAGVGEYVIVSGGGLLSVQGTSGQVFKKNTCPIDPDYIRMELANQPGVFVKHQGAAFSDPAVYSYHLILGDGSGPEFCFRFTHPTWSFMTETQPSQQVKMVNTVSSEMSTYAEINWDN